MAPQLPQKFGPYTLHELVGRGGMAEIYRATMPGIGGFEKTVAIKKILPHLTENDEFITMLIDEARIIVSINHFNIAQVYDLGKIDDSYYIAMEYIHGIDLAGIIKAMAKQGGYVPIPHAVYIGSSICAGLHVAHSKTDEEGRPLNIVHRDVSPHNILLSFAGDVKIIDFGVAKASVKETHTKMGVIKGKLLYMAPEQAMAKPVDGRSDLFAAGLIMYKMLTNRLPFQGDNEFQIYNNILTKEITPPRVINPDVPQVVDDIIMKLLARDPETRYQDGYSAKQDLDRALHQVAPGYTVNRLSRFIDENFAQQARPNATAPGPSPAPGQVPDAPPELIAEPLNDPDELDTVNVGADAVRASLASAPPPPPAGGQFRASASTDQTGEFHIPTADGPMGSAGSGGGFKISAPILAVAAMAIVVIGLAALAVISSQNGGDESLSENSGHDELVASADEIAPAEVVYHELVVESEPEGARVYMEADVVGITPIRLPLQESHDPILFTLEMEGFEDQSFQFVPMRDWTEHFDLLPIEVFEEEEEEEEEQASAPPEPAPERRGSSQTGREERSGSSSSSTSSTRRTPPPPPPPREPDPEPDLGPDPFSTSGSSGSSGSSSGSSSNDDDLFDPFGD